MRNVPKAFKKAFHLCGHDRNLGEQSIKKMIFSSKINHLIMYRKTQNFFWEFWIFISSEQIYLLNLEVQIQRIKTFQEIKWIQTLKKEI